MSRFDGVRKKIKKRHRRIHFIYFISCVFVLILFGYLMGIRYEEGKRNQLQHLGSLYKRDTDSLKNVISKLENQYRFLDSIPIGSPLIGNIKVTSNFGLRVSPIDSSIQFHNGIDLRVRHKQLILSTADGTVEYSGYSRTLGNFITIKHAFGYKTRYAHLSKRYVINEDLVKRGTIIGISGQTGRSAGPHLHYEILVDNVRINPKKHILK